MPPVGRRHRLRPPGGLCVPSPTCPQKSTCVVRGGRRRWDVGRRRESQVCTEAEVHEREGRMRTSGAERCLRAVPDHVRGSFLDDPCDNPDCLLRPTMCVGELSRGRMLRLVMRTNVTYLVGSFPETPCAPRAGEPTIGEDWNARSQTKQGRINAYFPFIHRLIPTGTG